MVGVPSSDVGVQKPTIKPTAYRKTPRKSTYEATPYNSTSQRETMIITPNGKETLTGSSSGFMKRAAKIFYAFPPANQPVLQAD